MSNDWRQDLKTHPKVRELDRRLALRAKELRKDKEFVIQEARLRTRLESFLAERPADVRRFFQKFQFPVGPRGLEARRYLRRTRIKNLKEALDDYLNFVVRFGVVFRLEGKRSSLRLEYLVPWGTKFHVKLVEEQFMPAERRVASNESYEDYFEDDRLTVPVEVQRLIASGKGKFVLIEDPQCSSALSGLEYFANNPEGLTFVVHNAEQPYLLCLIGEKVSDKDWKRASAPRTALLRKYFNRGKAGRPPKIARLRSAIELRTRPGSIKSKISVPDEKKFESELSYVSRVGAALRK